ncbi:ACP S-malonyltransferase [Fischerella thermalis]|jgi:[acyl-carrier-protein] S-malonyltransferase|uniref:Malonyl CoA-acyl carrier protein transacylase n=2 Tax=Fischerella TaxID=1190 RepID=G6FUF2_9CYAN|nr:ACP S-malonyltransferase [Fischerella thermalis]PMB10203.1 [acyl-carrier-protein] S-malonyltransferase [Fischerella thermalis CCMEE 5273]PMB13141.1 [acyl-carrier-protein] S-malonyltransferase [Fischerella thermalis CCMEE 5328]EHC12882.1 malonyl CoA-acyl carrier protein transacylase [Fischerella thermalis JSC-11]PLZ07676.1 malonyl CoA-acyl carrier protein transacylase [Fischerella thermalis WC1110]PLZ09800.1 malonyl CoA-acyl carrier protein transacylase [Fischerella thermalis WC114]
MTKTAWVFPGQGSQSLGMGMDLINIPLAKDKFAQAEEILGWSVIEICQNDADKLSHTIYTQPCLYVVESILADLLQEKQQPDLVAGHSLGEYIALYVAGVFEWSAGLRLVKRRAELMDSAVGGMMVALMNFDREQLEKVIAETPDVVVANDNSPAQVVISGTPTAVQAVISQVKAKRAVPLKVSGAFHSPLMAEASTQFQEILASVEFHKAKVPVLSNIEPTPATEAEILKQRLIQQMTGGVRWREIALALPENGIERVVEIGPGNVLTGLIKRTCSDLILENMRNLAELST